MDVWFQFHGSVWLPVCYIQNTDSKIDTPSDITCAHGDLARQRLSIMFQPTIDPLGV